MHDGRILPFDSVMPSFRIQFLHTKKIMKSQLDSLLQCHNEYSILKRMEFPAVQFGNWLSNVLSFFFNSDKNEWWMKFRWLFQCYFIKFVMILFYILTISLTFPFFFARQKQFETFGKKNIGLKNTKVAWGSRPWRAERREWSSQIMFGSLNSVSTLGKMLLMMMSVIIFVTKTNNNISHMIYSWLCRGAFFAWRAPILSLPRIMCSQVLMLKFLELSREMP